MSWFYSNKYMRFWETRNKIFNITNEGETEEGFFCYRYIVDKTRIGSLDLIISMSTVIVNLVVRETSVYLVGLIGLNTESLKSSFITMLVFISYYFNTGWLIILADANMKGQGKFLENIFTGRLSDFNMDWYRKEGIILC